MLRLHPEAELVAVEVMEVEITHAIRIVFRFFQCSGAFRLQLPVERIDIRDENIYSTMAGLGLGLARGLKVGKHARASHAGVERRLDVSELGVKAKHLAVMLDAAQDIFNDKYGCGAEERNRSWACHWNLHSLGGLLMQRLVSPTSGANQVLDRTVGWEGVSQN